VGKLINVIKWTRGEIRIPAYEVKKVQRQGFPRPKSDRGKNTFPPESSGWTRRSAREVAEDIAAEISNIKIR
jgi:hypothetical protein